MVVFDGEDHLRLMHLNRIDEWLEPTGKLEYYEPGNVVTWIISRKWLSRAEDT